MAQSSCSARALQPWLLAWRPTHPALAADPPGKGITMYMQMGGKPGDGATLARQTGAAAAAQALGVDSLNEQFSGWAPETMIEQFKQAMAAKPGLHRDHGPSGHRRVGDLVKEAVDQGITVTHGNAPIDPRSGRVSGPRASAMSASSSIEGGKLTAEGWSRTAGSRPATRPWSTACFSQAERGQSEKGLAETLEDAGLKVDQLEITQEVNSDASLAVPVLAAYVQSHPDLKAIGTQHGGVTGVLRRGR